VLTPREQDILSLVREGLTNEQIAARLGITFETAKTHVSQILSKLGVETREAAAAWREERRRTWWQTPIRWAIVGSAGAALVGLALLAWGALRTTTEPALLTGRIAFVSDRDGDYDIWVANADGSGLRQVTQFGVNPHIASVQWSPDGERIFFTYRADEALQADSSSGTDIYSIAEDGSGLTQVTNTNSSEQCLIVTHQGELLYVRNQKLLTSRSDGSDERPIGGGKCPTDVSPDGKSVLYNAGTVGLHYAAPEVWIAGIDGRDARRLTSEFTYTSNGVWSPDGTRIAFACRHEALIAVQGSDPGDPVALCLEDRRRATITAHTVVDSGIFGPSWSPDGNWLLFQSNVTLYLSRPDGSDTRRLTECACQEWSADWWQP
jgi:TolB protein